uniref:Uncharacterized protein n=1 Tax=Ananas comosus var. bracteatus TaxID=296719 RepID=A0A6V7QI73_ANACO|nr:unnamed protein product [Ananas comosus var. bracteatus]
MVGETIATELADLLRSQGDWRTYLETIAQKDWSGATTKALMWSYQHLPAHLHVASRTAACILEATSSKLENWFSSGWRKVFIKPDDQNETMEDAGNGYLEKLVSRFYIQFHNRDSHSFGTVEPDDKRSIREVMRNRTQEWFRHQYKEDLVRNEREMRNFIATMNGREHNNSVPAADADIAAVWGRWLETYERKTELIYSRQNEAKLHLPSTITRLWLEGCNMTDHALSVCLQNLPSLTKLLLADLKMITRLPSADVLANLISLQTLRLSDCWALTSLGANGIITVWQPPISSILDCRALFWSLILGGFAGTALSKITHSGELPKATISGEGVRMLGGIPVDDNYGLRNMLCNVEKRKLMGNSF